MCILTIDPGHPLFEHRGVEVGRIAKDYSDQSAVLIAVFDFNGDCFSGDHRIKSGLRFTAEGLAAFGCVDAEQANLFGVAVGRSNRQRIAVGDVYNPARNSFAVIGCILRGWFAVRGGENKNRAACECDRAVQGDSQIQ